MKRIDGEPVKLVQSFDELRPGMIVYDVHCGRCDRDNCRSILGNRQDVEDDGDGCAVAFEQLPDCAPDGDTGTFCGICQCQVVERRIFRVVDAKFDSTGERTARELERVR